MKEGDTKLKPSLPFWILSYLEETILSAYWNYARLMQKLQYRTLWHTKYLNNAPRLSETKHRYQQVRDTTSVVVLNFKNPVTDFCEPAQQVPGERRRGSPI